MDTLTFLETLYGALESGYVLIWHMPNKLSKWFSVTDLPAAAQAAAELSTLGRDVYFGLGVSKTAKQINERAIDTDIIAIPGLWVDIDIADSTHKTADLPRNIDEARIIINTIPLEPSIVVTSGHGIHCYYLFREPWVFDSAEDRDRAATLLKNFQGTLRQTAVNNGWKLDSTHDLTRVLRVPGTMNYKSDPIPVTVISESPARYNPDDLDQYVITTPATPTDKRDDPFARRPTDRHADTVINNCKFVQHCRDNAATLPEPEWLAMVTNVARCISGPEIVHELSSGYPGYSAQETDKKIMHALTQMHPQTCSYIKNTLGFAGCPVSGCEVKSPCGWALAANKRKNKNYNQTDVGNSDRFVDMFQNDLKYCYSFGRWLVWTGCRWEMDETGKVMDYAKRCIRAMYAELTDIADDDERKKRLKHITKSESITRIKAMVELSQNPLAVTVDEMDADPWLLNVKNGVLDLKTGRLLPPDPTRIITKLAPVTYDYRAECPRFLQFLHEVFPNSDNLIPFIQRLAGYSLTGDTSEQKMAIAWGSGANGKSTLLNLLLDMLGGYGKTTPTETLLARKNEGIPNDIAMLMGSRFVLASEAQEGRRLNEPLIKQATGQDRMTARFLHKEFFSFQPSFKMVLLTNHKPLARGDDGALWRRLMLIPFTQKFEGDKKDKSLPDKLRAEMPGILRWCVQGCLEWQRVGLNPPDEVIQATNEYRSENDVLESWIEDCCKIANYVTSSSGDLYKSFQEWAAENGEKSFVSSKTFGRRLVQRGFTPFKGTGGKRKMKGIGLIEEKHASPGEMRLEVVENCSNNEPY